MAAGPDAFIRQAVRAPGTALTADPTSPTGISWSTRGKSIGGRAWALNDQVVPSSAPTGVVFQAEDDPDRVFDASTHKMLVPPGYAGRWRIQASLSWSGHVAGTHRAIIEQNFVPVARSQFDPADDGLVTMPVFGTFRAAVGDVFGITCYQTSGTTLSLQGRGAAAEYTRSDTWLIGDYLGGPAENAIQRTGRERVDNGLPERHPRTYVHPCDLGFSAGRAANRA